MLNNKKVLIISLLTVILLFFSVSNCFASTPTTSEEPFEGTLSDDVLSKVHNFMNDNNFTDYIFCYGSYLYNVNFFIFFNSSESGMLYEFYNSSYRYYYLKPVNACSYVIYTLSDFTSSDTVFDKELFFCEADNNLCTGIYDTPITFFDSTVDIYDSNKVDLVFQVPPVVEAQAVVANQLEGVQMIQVMKEIMGVLPLIIVVVVSLVGLRKALQMLSTLLHKV